METYMERRSKVEDFVAYVFPQLEIETHMLHDVAGPTGSIEDIDALVLSKETISGGVQINKIRQSKGWRLLTVYDVNVIGCISGSEKDNYKDKLSSTEIRRLEFEKLRISDTPTKSPQQTA